MRGQIGGVGTSPHPLDSVPSGTFARPPSGPTTPVCACGNDDPWRFYTQPDLYSTDLLTVCILCGHTQEGTFTW